MKFIYCCYGYLRLVLCENKHVKSQTQFATHDVRCQMVNQVNLRNNFFAFCLYSNNPLPDGPNLYNKCRKV